MKDIRTAFSARHLESNSLSLKSQLIMEALLLGVAASDPRRIIEKSQNISNVTEFIISALFSVLSAHSINCCFLLYDVGSLHGKRARDK